MQEPLIAVLDRELTKEDLVALAEPRETKAPSLRRLSTRHHALARALAEGMTPGEAALMCNYVLSRVSILQDDPTFQELVNHYRKMVDAQYLDLHNRLAGLSMDAAGILADRMEDKPEEFENIELMKLVALGADRTGYGPSSTTNHNHVVGFANRLDKARERAAALRAPVIDVEIVEDD